MLSSIHQIKNSPWYPLNRNSVRNQTIGPRTLQSKLASRASAVSIRRGLAGLGDIGALSALGAATDGYTAVGTPTQLAAMIAANAPVPALSDPVMPDYDTMVRALVTINWTVPKVPMQTTVATPYTDGSGAHTSLPPSAPLATPPASPIATLPSGSFSLSAQQLQNIQDSLSHLNLGLAGLSTSTGLGSLKRLPRGRVAGQLGALGQGPSTTQLVETAAATGASMIAVGAGIGAFAGPIGAAVGAVVGIIAGLFHHKTVSPPTTQAQIDAARNMVFQYKGIAGSCLGRSYPQSVIQDLTMAMCILADVDWNNAGGCGNQAGIVNSWNEQLARLNLFFTALASNPIGAMITLRDIPSLPGHGKTNMNVSYTFPNPGPQAPNYILGPFYAQYFYVMCNIFQNEQNCTGWQLTAPMPQYICDLIDWFRAQHSQWDIPAGTIDPPVVYPTLSLVPGQVNEPNATPTQPALSPPAVGINPGIVGASLTITGSETRGGQIQVTGAQESGGQVIAVPRPPPPLQSNPANSPLGPGGNLNFHQPGIVAPSEFLGLSNSTLWLLGGAAALFLILAETRPR
jgi:hypothetical protein